MPKRAREAVSEADATSSQAAAPRLQPSQNSRERKRTRVEQDGLPDNDARPPEAAVINAKTIRKRAKPSSVPVPPKRTILPGRIKRLAVPKPQSLAVRQNRSGSTKTTVNRRGNKINKGLGTGGFDVGVPVDQEDVGAIVTEDEPTKSLDGKDKKLEGVELWVTRKTSYPAYLRSGVAAFMEKGNHTLILRALGAAIPVCLSLALAIREALPCGEAGTNLEVRTGSVDVSDEVIPNDDSEGEDADIQYQTRTKSSVECILCLKRAVRQRLLVKSSGVTALRALGAREMGVRPGRGGRGKPIRGGLRGRGGSRAR